MLHQVVQFIPSDGLCCELYFNVVSIVYQKFKIPHDLIVKSFAEEISKTALTVRNIRADTLMRTDLTNTLSHRAKGSSCDQCIGLPVEGTTNWSVDSLDSPPRDQESWARDVPEKTTFLGRKGPTPLLQIPNLIVPQSLTVDPMHCLFLGLGEFFIRKFLLEDKAHEKKGQRVKILDAVNEQFCRMRVPTEGHRSTKPYNVKFKSSEYKNWHLLHGHIVATIFFEYGEIKIATFFSRFTFLLRALLLDDDLLEAVEREHDLMSMVREQHKDVEDILGLQNCNLNLHNFKHVLEWRRKYRLHEFSAEQGEHFYGLNKKSMDNRNCHYGVQVHINRLIRDLRGHFCLRTYRIRPYKEHSDFDDSLISDEFMNIYR